MTTKEKNSGNNGFAIASLILAIVGLILIVSIFGMFLGIIAIILGLIFGIIALTKKQKKSMAIIGITISGLVILFSTIGVIVASIFIKNNKDIIIEPIKEFSTMFQEDPELVILMNNYDFQKEFEYLFKEKMFEKFGTGFEPSGRNDIKKEIPEIFIEMKNTILDLKDKYQSEEIQSKMMDRNEQITN